MERLLFDLRLALRQLVWSPGFSIAAILLILALGIGTSSAVFSVVDSILFRPLLLPDSERLVTLCEAHGGDRAYCTASPANAMDWQANVRTLEAVGVARERGVEIRDGGRKLAVPAAMATLAMRTREFGIRMALGARRAQVLGSVLLDGGKLLAAGLLLGMAGAFYFTRLLRSALRDIAPSDPLAVIGTILVLGLTGAVATLAPALRASRTEPVNVLRGD